MDHTVDSLEALFASIDDSQAGSPDRQTHLIHLETFFPTLAANGLAIVPMADRNRLLSRPSGYQATAKISRHGKLLPLYSSWLRLPFVAIKTDLLKDSPKTLERTAASEEAFQGAERLLTKAVPLQHPSAQAKLSLATDTSDSLSEVSCSKNLVTIGFLLVFSRVI